MSDYKFNTNCIQAGYTAPVSYTHLFCRDPRIVGCDLVYGHGDGDHDVHGGAQGTDEDLREEDQVRVPLLVGLDQIIHKLVEMCIRDRAGIQTDSAERLRLHVLLRLRL